MLAATMTVSVLAGCGGNQNEGNTNEKENVTNSNEDTQRRCSQHCAAR